MNFIVKTSLLALALCINASIAIADTEESAIAEYNGEPSNGYVLTNSIWATKVINVCWENTSATTSAERTGVEFAVKQTWERASKIRFVGWNQCYAGSQGIRILAADDGPHVKGLGRNLDGMVNGMSLNFTYQNWGTSCQYQKTYCNRVIAIHEFGHAMGFAHEHNRPDTPSTCNDAPQGTNGDVTIGDWDLYSVMNYCSPDWINNGELSDGDQLTAALYYDYPDRFVASRWATQLGGYPSSSKFVVGDYNGDGNDDIAKIYSDQGLATISIYRSNGAGGFTNVRWATQAGGFTDAQNWLAADFDGDGRDELANVFNDSGKASVDIHNMSQWPHTFSRWVTQQGGFTDAQQWFAGDFDNDGLDDLAKVFDDQSEASIGVHINTGANFQLSRWMNKQGGFWPAQRWVSADFDGDGAADIAKIIPLGSGFGKIIIDILTANSGSFNQKRWTSQEGFYTTNMQWLAGEFSKDGQADIMSLFGQSGLTSGDLYEANGAKFDVDYKEAYYHGSYSTGFVWLAGDFNGDSRGDFAKISKQSNNVNIAVHKGVCRTLLENCN